MFAAIAAQHRRQRRQHAGADEADAQRADLAATDAARFGQVFSDGAQSAPGAVEEDFAGGSEADGARCPREQLMADDLFKLTDLLR